MEQSPLVTSLNPVQREAVLHTDGPVLIVAGAGSGKTRALTHRIAYLIREKGVHPGAILAITFTNKAAREMVERVEGLLGERVAKGMWILTFHATCARILRREHGRLGLPSAFTIYDDGDTERLITGVLKDLDLDPKRYPPRQIAAAISRAKDHVVSAEEYADAASTLYEKTVAQVFLAYEERKQAAGALDFDDLIGRTVRLFREHPDALAMWQSRFRYLMVDEYQDTSRAQYQLVNQLAAGHRNLCVVGDADQGVYSWRGATIQNLLDFERDYPDATVFLMEQNYRSTSAILGIANALIAHNRARKPKSLWTETDGGELAVRYRAQDEHEEAAFVAEEAARLVDEEGYRYDDIAVFYRTNAQSRVFETVFAERAIEVRLVGGVRFFERREIKDLVGYLRLLVNPQDVMAGRRVINTPKRGIGEATVAALEDHARTEGIPFLEACRRVDEIGILGARAKGAVAVFVGIMDRLAKALESGAGVSRMVQAASAESGYLAELEAERTVEAEGRAENLKELVTVAAEFESTSPDGTLAEFLEQVALVSDADEIDDGAGGKVTFMTLHTAKGLEYPVVFMVGMEDNVFPHFRSMGNPDQLEEERRLAYVGVTRARQRLYLTNAWERSLFGQTSYNPPSRFLAEMPTELVRALGDEEEPGGRVIGRRAGGAAAAPASSPVTIAAPARRPPLRVEPGDTVRHDRYGEGVVIAISGRDDDLEAHIRFDDGKERRLLLAYAPLARVG
ncbi:MAG: DNA helicase PcrA [Actinomycetota bacterium]